MACGKGGSRRKTCVTLYRASVKHSLPSPPAPARLGARSLRARGVKPFSLTAPRDSGSGEGFGMRVNYYEGAAAMSKKRIAWIETVDESEADGDVAAAYAECDDSKTGQVDHIMKIHSLNPQ